MKGKLVRPSLSNLSRCRTVIISFFSFMVLMISYFTSLQVSDVEQIMGLVQAENIQVHAESYDVALDMSFPKGF